MPNTCISLCKHGPRHANARCSYAHCFAELRHPGMKGYPAQFWAESVSYYYGQRLSDVQGGMIQQYAENEMSNGLPQWVCEYLQVDHDDALDERDVYTLQSELCGIFSVASVKDIFEVSPDWDYQGGIPENPLPKRSRHEEPVYADTQGRIPEHPMLRRRRHEEGVYAVEDESPADEPVLPQEGMSVLTTVSAPMAEACLGMMCRAEYPTLGDQERVMSHLYSTKNEPFLPWSAMLYEQALLDSIAANIARFVASGKVYHSLTLHESAMYVTGLSFREETGIAVFVKDLPSRPLYFNGILLQELFRSIRNDKPMTSSKCLFADMSKCIREEHAVFEYLGNGILVRSYLLVDCTVDRAVVIMSPSHKIAGYAIEVLSAHSLRNLDGPVAYMVL